MTGTILNKEQARKHKAMEIQRRNDLRKKIKADQERTKKFLQRSGTL